MKLLLSALAAVWEPLWCRMAGHRPMFVNDWTAVQCRRCGALRFSRRWV